MKILIVIEKEQNGTQIKLDLPKLKDHETTIVFSSEVQKMRREELRSFDYVLNDVNIKFLEREYLKNLFEPCGLLGGGKLTFRGIHYNNYPTINYKNLEDHIKELKETSKNVVYILYVMPLFEKDCLVDSSQITSVFNR